MDGKGEKNGEMDGRREMLMWIYSMEIVNDSLWNSSIILHIH